MSLLKSIAVVLAASFAFAAQAQTPYGPPISLENAKKVVAAAAAEARKNNWMMSMSVLDSGGQLVYFERMDGAQLASVEVSQGKARAAVMYKRPTKAFFDDLAAGGAGLRYLGFPGIIPSDGGELIMVDGKIIGAIGISGATGAQDGQVARAGTAALK